MSAINFDDYTNYNTGYDFSALLGGTTKSSGNLLSDYALIRNGSYKKLLKAYYAEQDAESASSGDTTQKLTLMRSSSDSLKKSADALNDASLWEKKKITKMDEETGEEIEVEDYDWNAITKAVKSFIDDYNSVVEQAGASETKDVLRNAVWMTNMTDKAQNLLSQVGINIGKGNKLELDEEAFQKANITTLKSLFMGYGSFANKISQKADSISNAVVRTKGATYTSSGSYSNTLSNLFSSTIDKTVGDNSLGTSSKSDSSKVNEKE